MNPLNDTFKTTFQITIGIIGVWFGVLHSSSLIPLSLFPVLIPSILIYFLHIPQPSGADVQRIIGSSISDNEKKDECSLEMKAIAHRGACLDAPENTLEAFKMCAEKNIRFIEFDVRLSGDKVPVVFHNGNIEKSPDTILKISQTSYKSLKTVDLTERHQFRKKFNTSFMPTLFETVELLIDQEQRMFIDIKENNCKIVRVVLDLFKTYPELYSKAVVSSFYPNIIYCIRRKNPRIVCSLAYRPYCFSYPGYSEGQYVGEKNAKTWLGHVFNRLLDIVHLWLLPKITYYLLGISLIIMHKDCINFQILEDWKNKNVRVIAWTLNHPVEKEYFYKVLKCSYMTDTFEGEETSNPCNRY